MTIVDKINEYVLNVYTRFDREITLLPMHPSEYALLKEELGKYVSDNTEYEKTTTRPTRDLDFLQIQIATPIGYVTITQSIHANLLLESPKYTNFCDKLKSL